MGVRVFVWLSSGNQQSRRGSHDQSTTAAACSKKSTCLTSHLIPSIASSAAAAAAVAATGPGTGLGAAQLFWDSGIQGYKVGTVKCSDMGLAAALLHAWPIGWS
jgi:hypothetical protein